MNSAIQEAKKLYAKHGLDLNRDLSDYLDYGYVFVTPDRMMLARPVKMDEPEEWLLPEEAISGNNYGWYVHLAVGEGCLKWFCEQMPYYLPHLLWRRDFKTDGGYHIFVTDRFLSKINN